MSSIVLVKFVSGIQMPFEICTSRQLDTPVPFGNQAILIFRSPLYWATEPMSFNNSSFWVEREDSQRMRAKLYQFNLIHIFNVFLIKMIQIVKTNHKKLRISNFANSGNLKIKNQILMNKRQSNITLKEIRTCAAFGSDSTANNID